MRTKLVLMLVVFAMVAAACSSAGDNGDTGPNPDTTTPVTADGHTPGVLRINGGDPSTLDPIMCGDVGCARVLDELYDGPMVPIMYRNVVEYGITNAKYCQTIEDFTEEQLAQLGYEANQAQLAADEQICLMPNIAADWPDKVINADGTVTYTFQLRDDVFWQNDPTRAVTADDLKYSWERGGKRLNGSSTFPLYMFDIIGARDMYRDRARSISGVEVVDDFTLRVTIDADKPYWLWNMAYTTSFVVDKVQVESQKNWTNSPDGINGTGPYILRKENFVPGNYMTLIANKNYHLGAPNNDRVELDLTTGDALAKYNSGALDATGIGAIEYNQLMMNPDNPLNKELVVGRNEIGTSYIALNTEDPVLGDVRVRKALALAIPKEEIVEKLFFNRYVVAYTFTPPGMPEYVPPVEAGVTYDPEAARELLREAGYTLSEGSDGRWSSNVPPLTFMTSGGGANSADYVQVVIDVWQKELGITVTTDNVGDFKAFRKRLKFGDWKITSFGWVADYPDPQDFGDLKLTCERGPENNETRYCNEEFDVLIIAARTEQDVARRMELYREAEALMLQDFPIVPMFHAKNMLLRKPYVEGLYPQPMIMPRYRFVTVN